MKNIFHSLVFCSVLFSGTVAYSNDWIGKNLLTCSKSFGTTVKNYTSCKFGPALIQVKSEYSLKYSLTYSYQCNGGRLNFGLSFGEGAEQSFQRMENGSSKKEFVYEGHGPIQTLDNKPSNTDGALFAGECLITLDSFATSLSRDSQKLFDDYSDLIGSIGVTNAGLKAIDSNTALLATLLAKFDIETLGSLVRNIRDNVVAMIEAREAIEEKTAATKEVLKTLTLVRIDIDGKICQSPVLKESNKDICAVEPSPIASEGKSISDVLSELQTASDKLLTDNTDIISEIVGKVWTMTSPLSETDRAPLRAKICEKLSKAKILSTECPN